MPKMRLWPGLCHKPRWGSTVAPPESLAGFKRLTSKGREWTGEERRRREGKGRGQKEKRAEKGRRGEERERAEREMGKGKGLFPHFEPW